MITIPGQPQGKARARTVNRNGITRTYTPQKTSDYESLIALCYKAQGGGYHPYEPIQLHIQAYYEIPKSWSRKIMAAAINGERLPAVKPDCDNVIKIVADALNGIAYRDDKQIISVSMTKYYSQEPRLELYLQEYIKAPPL